MRAPKKRLNVVEKSRGEVQKRVKKNLHLCNDGRGGMFRPMQEGKAERRWKREE